MSEAQVERRLAAILAADVVGYSRLIGADERGTLNRLKLLRAEVIDPQVTAYRGRLVKTTGDGLLVEFQSVVDALCCAREVQQRMAERGASTPPAERIEYRIGINVGDVVVEDGDIFGDGVNVAARLETLAEPGGICVSARVQEDATGRLDIVFEDLGEQNLKNIARPIRVYRVRAPSLTGPPAEAALPLPDKPSIAVLPFQNMTGEVEQEYFVDGMVEEITTAIARLPWLFVIARNSAFTYKGKAIDVKQVACELGVRYVLEGSVRKAGNRVRITGQLIDTPTGAHIWADRFDGALDDIFELQDQVASSVVGAIDPKLRMAEIERAGRKPTASLGAYDLYLRAMAEFNVYTKEALNSVVVLLRRALALDPSYAPAAALLGWCLVRQRLQGWGALSDTDRAEGVLLARQALSGARDDSDTMAHAAWTLYMLGGEWARAAAVLDRAVALNPNAANAWAHKGWVHALRNQPDAAIEAFERVVRLSPFDLLGYQVAGGIALAHLAAGRLEQAIEWADRGLHQQPLSIPTLTYKVVASAHLGRLDEALGTLERVLAIKPGWTMAARRAERRPLAPELTELIDSGFRLAGLPEE
jgi:TolB-like protein/predicted Zn-dependent protease